MRLQDIDRVDLKRVANKHVAMKNQRTVWSALLIGALIAMLFAFTPATAQASTEWWPKFWGNDSAIPGFWLTGEVVSVEESSVTLQLPNHRHTRGMMRHVRLHVTLDVDTSSVLLDGSLEPLELSTLVEGEEVVVVPRLVWGNLVARLLYAGDPKDLAESTYRGVLVEQDEDSLTLRHGRKGEITVQVDENTIWYDEGLMERPAELPEEIRLRVLGVEEENEQGDEVIRAVLITPNQ